MNFIDELRLKTTNRETRYWQKNLAYIAPFLDFPTDRARSSIDDEKAQLGSQENDRQYLFRLTQNLSCDLQKIAQQQKVTLESILLVAWQVLLYRYTHQSEVTVGCLPQSDRLRQIKLELLPIKAVIEGEQTFSQLLATIHNQVLEASSYTDISLTNLVQTLQTENPNFSANSLTQIMFRSNGFLEGNSEDLNKVISGELLLEITKKSQDLTYKLKYNPLLFNTNTISRIGNNYQVLLRSIMANPDATIDSLSLISSAEKQQVLYEWNQTETKSVSKCIHQLFEARVKQNPSAVAILYGEQQLTYGELNQQANQLAYFLQAKGVTPGSLVGLGIERSPAMVVGVLAILKTGSAYVPLDVTNPTARIAFILEDAQVKVLLTQESLLNKLPAEVEQTICGDLDRDLIAQCPEDNLNLDLTISDLAQIVYTSGSTGKPKGVMLTHGNLSHYAQSLQLALNITPADVYLHRGSIALIVSARQLLMPLTQGATVLIVTTAETGNPIEFFELIKRHGVTIVDHVPSFWRNFWGILNQQEDNKREALLDNQVRLVAAGGEQVTPEIYQCWRETFKSDVQLANIYGQTEGTGVVTVYQIPEQIDQHFKSLPVGSPIPNMRVYLLDKHLQPVPIGVTAEIHISGAGVAQGYLNRPELTAEKFVPNPIPPRSPLNKSGKGERLYKTGDLGRYLPALKGLHSNGCTASHNGTIQFLGRVDRQVNIQGLRIELGEIEAVLSQSELVVEAAVIVRENNLGKTLCAYIVPSKEQPTVEMLRSYLEQRLPAYMIPNTFLFVDTFPLTTSGKVDRRALATLDIEESSTIITPRDRTEAEIVQMLENILGIETIGVRDNFIELGGNSLLAARLVTEIENRYDQTIPISRVFQAPTPEVLAGIIRQEEQVTDAKSFVPIKQGNSELTLFCIHNLGYGLEFYRPLAQYLNPDINLYGLSSSLDNDADVPHFRDVMNSAAYYVHELQKIQPQGPYHLIAVSFGGVIAYEVAQLLVNQGQEVEFLGLLDTFCPQQNAERKILPLKERVVGHLQKIRGKGLKHIGDRLKWRVGVAMDNIRYSFYKIDWLRENFADQTSREFAQTKYVQQLREQQKLNQEYSIQPYPGKVCLFRAADDMDSKLDWQQLAKSGLSIYDIPGEHLEILEEPNVQVLAEKIQLELQQLTNCK